MLSPRHFVDALGKPWLSAEARALREELPRLAWPVRQLYVYLADEGWGAELVLDRASGARDREIGEEPNEIILELEAHPNDWLLDRVHLFLLADWRDVRAPFSGPLPHGLDPEMDRESVRAAVGAPAACGGGEIYYPAPPALP